MSNIESLIGEGLDKKFQFWILTAATTGQPELYHWFLQTKLVDGPGWWTFNPGFFLGSYEECVSSILSFVDIQGIQDFEIDGFPSQLRRESGDNKS